MPSARWARSSLRRSDCQTTPWKNPEPQSPPCAGVDQGVVGSNGPAPLVRLNGWCMPAPFRGPAIDALRGRGYFGLPDLVLAHDFLEEPLMRRPTSRRAVLAVLVACLALAAPAVVVAKPASGCTSGTALVFLPNPVVTTGNENLTDQKDADQAVLNDQRFAVTLTGLDGCRLPARDVGQRRQRDRQSRPTQRRQRVARYEYTRHDDRFEQVMAYYWVTELAGLPPHPRLRRPAAGRSSTATSRRVRINQCGVDNSFATDHPKDEMRFGKGGVDDAEDAEVILHELGHQIHFSQSADFFATNEAGAISEGFGDYWAATVVEWAMAQAGVTELTEPECIMDWDSTSYTPGPIHCLRRLDDGQDVPRRPRRRGPQRRRDLVPRAVEPPNGHRRVARGHGDPARPSSTGSGRRCRTSRDASLPPWMTSTVPVRRRSRSRPSRIAGSSRRHRKIGGREAGSERHPARATGGV